MCIALVSPLRRVEAWWAVLGLFVGKEIIKRKSVPSTDFPALMV